MVEPKSRNPMFMDQTGADRGAIGLARASIGDYAVIGDCRSALLVSKWGSIDWACFPDFSGPSLFAAILDAHRGGRYSITPVQACRTAQAYIGATAVLETRFSGASGSARLLDTMAIGGSGSSLEPMREIIRIVEGIDGVVAFDVHFEPRPDYGRSAARILPKSERTFACQWRNEHFLLRSGVPLEASSDASKLCGRFEIGKGERLCFSLGYTTGDIGVLLPAGAATIRRLDRTLKWWEKWSAGCTFEGPRRAAVLRSAITLKLLTFPLSGAVVAAPTTSLPEAIGGERNWDYRYCWIRDAALTMRAFIGLGLMDEASAFLHWLLHATVLTQPRLNVMYDIYGRARLKERELDHLAGHRGSAPVRIGNDAHRQTQLDVYGSIVSAAADYVRAGGSLQRDQLSLLAGFGRVVCETWREPDHGIWEVRGGKRQYTFSKLMCWTALDQLLWIAGRTVMRLDRGAVERERAAIAHALETRGFNQAIGSYVGELDGAYVDASLLLMPCLGYKKAGDPRMRSTLTRIQERLGRNNLLHRYERGQDDFESREGAFGICSFWAVDNLAMRGEGGRADYLFGQLLAYGNDLGLFAEEIDPDTGEALGNFPQAFTHVGVINAALAIAKGEENGP